MTEPGIEPRSPGPSANTLPTRVYIYTYLYFFVYIYIYIYMCVCVRFQFDAYVREHVWHKALVNGVFNDT